MKRIISAVICMILFVAATVVCPKVQAGAFENASEFQEGIAAREEQQAENKEASTGSDDISWQDNDNTGTAASGSQAPQGSQQ